LTQSNICIENVPEFTSLSWICQFYFEPVSCTSLRIEIAAISILSQKNVAPLVSGTRKSSCCK